MSLPEAVIGRDTERGIGSGASAESLGPVFGTCSWDDVQGSLLMMR